MSKKITAKEAAEMVAGKDVVFFYDNDARAYSGDDLIFDNPGEVFVVKTQRARITDGEPEYTITDIIAENGAMIRFSD